MNDLETPQLERQDNPEVYTNLEQEVRESIEERERMKAAGILEDDPDGEHGLRAFMASAEAYWETLKKQLDI